MLAILGPSAKDLISSGDPVADRNKQDTFSLNYIGLHQFAAASDGRTFLYIGPNNWPTPIPLQKNASSQWYFDSDYGRQEILYRRIGANELNVIKVCGAIVEAQRDYYNAFHDGASVHQYTQRFRSSPGTQDGLYWDVKPGAAAAGKSARSPRCASCSRRLSASYVGRAPPISRLRLSVTDQSGAECARWRD